MKLKTLLISTLLLLTFAIPSWATIWFASGVSGHSCASGNMSTCYWYATPGDTTTCTPVAGTTKLTWNSQVAGDTFVANGCVGITVDYDPQGTGGSKGKVTLTTTPQTGGYATGGGTFLYPTSSNLTVTADCTAGPSVCLTISGSAGGGTFPGNFTGGSASGNYGILDSHTSVNLAFSGTITGSSANGSAEGYYYTGATANAATFSGSCVAQKAAGCETAGSGAFTVSGSCVGSSTDISGVPVGCFSNSTGVILVSGRLVWGGSTKFGPPIMGPFTISTTTATYAGTAAQYISVPGASVTPLYFTLVPPITDVTSGINYGWTGSTYYSGSASAGGGGCSVGY